MRGRYLTPGRVWANEKKVGGFAFARNGGFFGGLRRFSQSRRRSQDALGVPNGVEVIITYHVFPEEATTEPDIASEDAPDADTLSDVSELETEELEVEEPAITYESVMVGTIQTGNPHSRTIQSFTYYYYAITDESTPSEKELRIIMAELFDELNLKTKEGESYGIFLWPNVATAEANILSDGDWKKVDFLDESYISQAVGILTNSRFYNSSDYQFFIMDTAVTS